MAIIFETPHEIYKSALRLGKKYVAEHEDEPFGGMPAVLETILPKHRDHATVALGIGDIPMRKITGTLTASRATAFAGNFCPLLGEGSEFAAKWITLCKSHLEEGIREPGTAVEYLGYYYIIEGHKRVSVLRATDAPSAALEVTRILPGDGDKSRDAVIYRELLSLFGKKHLKNMWFSESGFADKLRRLSKDPDMIEDAFMDFRRAYRRLGYADLPITTGDAFLIYCEINGLPYLSGADRLEAEIKKLDRVFLSRNPKNTLKPIVPKERRVIFLGRPDPARDAGIRRFAAQNPDVTVETKPFAEAEDIENSAVFSTDFDRANDALKLMLSLKDTPVFQCMPRGMITFPSVLPTYYARTDEAAFVLGALAGALSKSGNISAYEHNTAFELGAKMTRDNAVVTVGPPVAGVTDIAWRGYTGEGRGFPGVYATLSPVSPRGIPDDPVAAAALHWNVYYNYVCDTLFGEEKQSKVGVKPIHEEFGLEEGLIDIHTHGLALGHPTRELVKLFKNSVIDNGIPKGENL